MGGILSLFKRQSEADVQRQSGGTAGLPSVGSAVPCLFSRQNEVVHAICAVEERQGADIMLRVLRELGKVSLAGLPVGSGGKLEFANQLLPFGVQLVQLPWVAITIAPDKARPVQRQFFRMSASFPVRFRRRGSERPWMVGKGIDVGNGGFCFSFTAPEIPASGIVYDTEITLKLTRKETETLKMSAEVRWATKTQREILVGLRVVDQAQRKDLTSVVSRLQHLMSRQPEDYVLVESPRPRLS
jgi:hypothetical protein